MCPKDLDRMANGVDPYQTGAKGTHWAYGAKMMRVDVDATASHRIDVNKTSFLRHVYCWLMSISSSTKRDSICLEDIPPDTTRCMHGTDSFTDCLTCSGLFGQ